MDLKNYFNETKGYGIISTSDSEGIVNSAIYATPHFLKDGEVSFIARDRLTKANLDQNSWASYLFMEKENTTRGLRLRLRLVSKSSDQEEIDNLSRRKSTSQNIFEKRFLLSFKVERIISLLGGEELYSEHAEV